jgi:hypothetical protein
VAAVTLALAAAAETSPMGVAVVAMAMAVTGLVDMVATALTEVDTVLLAVVLVTLAAALLSGVVTKALDVETMGMVLAEGTRTTLEELVEVGISFKVNPVRQLGLISMEIGQVAMVQIRGEETL